MFYTSKFYCVLKYLSYYSSCFSLSSTYKKHNLLGSRVQSSSSPPPPASLSPASFPPSLSPPEEEVAEALEEAAEPWFDTADALLPPPGVAEPKAVAAGPDPSGAACIPLEPRLNEFVT